MEFDSVQIGADDVATVAQVYTVLLGVPATGAQRFQLQRGAVEIEPGEPGLRSLRFAMEPHDASIAIGLDAQAFHGLRVRLDARATMDRTLEAAPNVIEAIDHVVIHSPNLQRAISLWRDRLRVRLALEREFPARGLQMAFFRSAGITLEFVSPLPAPAAASGPDRLYGLAYRVADLQQQRQRLLAAGIDVSPIRVGQKRDTIVATVRTGTAGVPTLLIQPAAAER